MANRFEKIARKSVLNIKPYVPGKPIEEVQRELGLKNVIKLASNENPLGPSKLAAKAARASIAGVNLYPEGSAYKLRNVLAEQLKVKPENLIFGNGSNELLNLIALAFVETGDEVIYSALSFVAYPIAVEGAGGTTVLIPHKQFRHDMEGFTKGLSLKTKLVFLCNPNNPTGAIITKKEVEAFLTKVPANVLVVLDEAYFEFVGDAEYPDGLTYIEKYPNVIVLRTFSKIYGLAGLRIGYGVAHQDIIEIVERVRPPFNTSIPAQAAALAALGDKAHLKKTVKTNNEGKKFLYAGFEKLGIKYVKTQGNFIFVEFKTNGKGVFEALLKRGVIIRPMYDNFGRITVGTMKENKKLIKALEFLD